jgi:undecaprenyl-diphosphatase
MAGFMLFAVIFNRFLKHIFKIPLLPHLGNGYAFPSGHMHAAMVFYGYALYSVDDRRIKALITAILLGEGFSLIYLKFHGLADLLGAIGFAVLEILCYHQLVFKFGKKRGEMCIAGISVTMSLLFTAILSSMGAAVHYVWIGFYGLVGIILSSLIDDRKLETLEQKFLALLTAVALNGLVWMVFKVIDFRYYFLSELKFLFIPLIMAKSIDFYGKREKRSLSSGL